MRTKALAAVAAGLLLAAPAPVPKHRPWVTGWDKPVNPHGDCKFDRKGDRLTITIPGKGQAKLLRDVEGDFVMQVRVSGGFTAGKVAGILLTDGEGIVQVRKAAVAHKTGLRHYLLVTVPPLAYAFDGRDRGDLAKPTCLRPARRGNRLTLKFSVDAKEWFPRYQFPVQEVKLSRKLKVGVAAEATTPGEFKPTFGRFKLSRPKE
jgi:hypothetical protein